MILTYIGTQGRCAYYWRTINKTSRLLYASVDGGDPSPVAR